MKEINKSDAHKPDAPAQPRGIGFGLFLVLAGLALLGERLGWLPQRFDWLFPAILIAWGAGEIFQRLRSG